MGILKDFMFEKTDVEKQKEAEEKANATATAGSKPIAKGKDVKFPTNDGTKFPETVGFPTNASVNAGMGNNFTPPPSTLDSNPYMEKTNKMYEEGFVKLNQPGYDFYEFYRAVTKGGVDNPQVYEMALEMGTAMDSDVSKQALTSQADFYISKNKIELSPDMDVDAILESIKEKYHNERVNDIDGIKIDFDNEWVHLRKSNTEPIIRIYSESDSSGKADHLAQKIMNDIKDILRES